MTHSKILMKLASYATPARKKEDLKGGGDKTIRPIFILWEKLVLRTLLCKFPVHMLHLAHKFYKFCC